MIYWNTATPRRRVALLLFLFTPQDFFTQHPNVLCHFNSDFYIQNFKSFKH